MLRLLYIEIDFAKDENVFLKKNVQIYIWGESKYIYIWGSQDILANIDFAGKKNVKTKVK